MSEIFWIPANDENVKLISTALSKSGFNVVNRIDTVNDEIWKLFIDSSLKMSDETFAEFVLNNDFSIHTIIGKINVYELRKIQKILFDCYERIINHDDQSEELEIN